MIIGDKNRFLAVRLAQPEGTTHADRVLYCQPQSGTLPNIVRVP